MTPRHDNEIWAGGCFAHPARLIARLRFKASRRSNLTPYPLEIALAGRVFSSVVLASDNRSAGCTPGEWARRRT